MVRNSPLITVIVMAFNEEGGLENTVKGICDTLSINKIAYEIVIVDDGSTDRTDEIAVALSENLENVTLVKHPTNLGLGAVYRTGFKSANGQFLTFFPADGQFPPTNIPLLLQDAGSYDLILGYIDNTRRPLVGRLLSLCEQGLYRCLFGKLPKFQGVLLIRRYILESMLLTSSGVGWTVIFEVIVRAVKNKLRIKSIPTEFCPRCSGCSKVGKICLVLDNVRQAILLRASI